MLLNTIQNSEKHVICILTTLFVYKYDIALTVENYILAWLFVLNLITQIRVGKIRYLNEFYFKRVMPVCPM